MPYGTFVATGALAGFITIAVMAGSESPRSTPVPLDDVHAASDLPVFASSTAQRPSVSLERNANLMFADLPASSGDAISPTSSGRMELPLDQRVIVYFGAPGNYRVGTLEAVDGGWVQLWLRDSEKRIWIAQDSVSSIEIAPNRMITGN